MFYKLLASILKRFFAEQEVSTMSSVEGLFAVIFILVFNLAK